jgi:hypothetical protein
MIYASDELDYFGCYCMVNLQIPVPKLDHPVEKILIASATSDIEDYFLYKEGVRSKVPKPTQYIPKHLKSIIRGLERVGFKGYTNVICLLLDMSYEYRDLVDASITASLHRSRESNGKLKDFTIMVKEYGFGFTYLCADCSQVPELVSWLPEFCLHKMNEAGVHKWVGIGRDISLNKPFVSVFFCNGDKVA